MNFDKYTVSCDNTKGPFGDEVIQGSCSMEYTLQVKTERLKSVQTLFLQKHLETTGFKPLKQLRCIDDNNLCDEYAPSTVTCKNSGYTNGNIGWKCDALNRDYVKFNRLSVNCEKKPGSENTDDIIKGSCSLR